MASLVVLVCPPGPLTAVGATLADWSTPDLLHPYLWVETSAWTGDGAAPGARPTRGRTPALLVEGGRATGTTVEATLTGRRFDRVRLVVLVPAVAGAEGVPSEVEHHLHQAVLNTSAVGHVDLIRLVVTRPDSGPVAADLAREGWHNLVIAPEESRGPGLGHSVLRPSTDPIEIAPDAAACVAGVAGLWRDLDAGPLDDVPAPFGQTLRLVRSFYRNLDATVVAEHVRAGLLSLDEGVPLPRQHGSQAVYIDDAAMAANDMAHAVLRRHAGLFRGERVAPAAVQAQNVGAGQALKWLFQFIGASVTMAPMKWYSMVFGDVSTAIANRTQQAVFGGDQSAYAVVAQGQLAAGAADWREVGRASAQLDQQLDAGTRTHEVAGDFSAVWEDYVESGLTLMDAGERSRTTPIQVGTERGVLRRVADCAPGPPDAFAVPGRIAAAIGIADVRAADPLGQHTFVMRLREVGGQPALARDADATMRDFEAWQQRTGGSYAARTGQLLSNQLIQTSNEVQQLMSSVSGGNEVDVSNAETQARQKRIAAWMRTLLFSFLGLAIVLGVLVGTSLLTWWGALAAGGAGLLAWLGGSFVLFAQGQRELFRDLNRRRAELSQAEANEANLRIALRDLHRQTEAYGQFLEWTRVLGVVLHAPFGDTSRARLDKGMIAEGFPLSTRVGRAEVDSEAAAEVVSLMRRDLYQTGWLSGPWLATLNDAGARLGVRGQDLSADPRRMFASRAGVSESALTAWADELERGGVGNAAGDQLWFFAMQRLAQPDYRSRLVTRVVLPGREDAEAALSSDEFMAGVGEQRATRGKFDAGVLGREARLESKDEVVETWPVERIDGLDRKAVLVELGAGLPDYTFDLGERVTPDTDGAAASIVPPDPFAGRGPAPGPAPGFPAGKPPVQAPGQGQVF
ncbi:MAG: hypothetical protein Q4F67_02620 [Propionibacteriaceae bacterium]|nr:hypothetical protein [Propionibacteriaceae bacterium]